MFNLAKQSHRSRLFRRFWKPAVATGAGGTAVAVWFEEILIFGEEILALLFFALVGGVMYLFNVLVFKSQMPRHEAIENLKEKGEKK